MGKGEKITSAKIGSAATKLITEDPIVTWPGRSFRDGDLIDFKLGLLPDDLADKPVGLMITVVNHTDPEQWDTARFETLCSIIGVAKKQSNGEVLFELDTASSPPASLTFEKELWKLDHGPGWAPPKRTHTGPDSRSGFRPGNWRLRFAVHGTPVEFRFVGDKKDRSTEFVRLPLIEDDDNQTVMLVVGIQGSEPGAAIMVQQIRTAGVANVFGSHAITDASSLTLNRRFMLLEGTAQAARGSGAAKDQFGNPLEFAIPVCAFEEVTTDIGSMSQEETTEDPPEVAFGDATPAVRRMFPIADLPAGAHKVKWAPPLREFPEGNSKRERTRWALELVNDDGSSLFPRRFLEGVHRWRNLAGFRITWEAQKGRAAAADDLDNTPEDDGTSDPLEMTFDPLKDAPETAKGKPAGRGATRMNNADKFHHMFRVLRGKTKPVSLTIDAAQPDILSISASQCGTSCSGLTLGGAAGTLDKSLPYAIATNRPDGGDWIVREHMCSGFHDAFGPARREGNRGTRRRNHWCAGFGPWLYFQLSLEPWGPAMLLKPNTKFDNSPGSITARNASRLAEWATGTSRDDGPDSWTGSVAGNALVRITNTHYETILGVEDLSKAPNKRVYDTVQGNTGFANVPRHVKPPPFSPQLKRDEEGTPLLLPGIASSIAAYRIDDMASNRQSGGNSFADVSNWFDLQGIDAFGHQTVTAKAAGAPLPVVSGHPQLMMKLKPVKLGAGEIIELVLTKVRTSAPGALRAISLGTEPATLANKLAVTYDHGSDLGRKAAGLSFRNSSSGSQLAKVELAFKPSASPSAGHVRLRFLGDIRYLVQVYIEITA